MRAFVFTDCSMQFHDLVQDITRTDIHDKSGVYNNTMNWYLIPSFSRMTCGGLQPPFVAHTLLVL